MCRCIINPQVPYIGSYNQSFNYIINYINYIINLYLLD